MKRAFRLTCIGTALSVLASAQAPLRFDVAAIKPANPDSNLKGIVEAQGTRLTAIGANVKDLVVFAYDLRPFQVEGGPRLAESARFSIDAKVEGTPSKQQVREMLRSLLSDRFGLTIHHETREQTVYRLTANPNHKLRPSQPGTRKGFTGRFDQELRSFRFESYRGTMPLLADFLVRQLNAIVDDATGLTGEFDYEFEAPDMSNFAPALPQIGLKLESQKGPVDFIVIDSVRQPSDN